MIMTAEQIVSAQKANVETLFGLTGLAFEGVEKLIELNIQVAKTAMSEAAQNAQAALSVKDARNWSRCQPARPVRTRGTWSRCKPACPTRPPRRQPPTAVTSTRSPHRRAPKSTASPK